MPAAKVFCISLSAEDLKRLDDVVDVMKATGLAAASRSEIIRVALEQMDLGRLQSSLKIK